MRVIAGEYGSRRLKAVPGNNTRPTTDKIKEGMFNLLGGFFDGGKVLDLYGGSGGLAIEAVSRGMDEAIITEKFRLAVQTIRENVAVTKEEEKFTILPGDNRATLKKLKLDRTELTFDLVLIDPPYKDQTIEKDIQWLEEQGLLNTETLILCESDDQTVLPETMLDWEKIKEKHYGQTFVRLYQRRS
uniref:16S rRNA (guanine(966)-N(2))-methyltransferase RsmD n=1 Tax=Jeotgalibaca porci TaxID=1868793 RepID=UPI00359F51F5